MAVHPATVGEDELLRECELQFTRRGGPGGQHRNKTETAVVVRHLSTGLSGEANERRSQAENRRLALFRLRLHLATGIRRSTVINDPPSELWLSRVEAGRLSVSAEHVDLPALLAEALDRLAANDCRLDSTVEQLRVSSSQLIKLLKQHRPALEWVNAERSKLGIGRLK